MTGQLTGRTAIVHGAAGCVGGAISRAFAAAGARVFLTGRTHSRLEAVAREITEAGGAAEVGVVDALDEAAVDAYVAGVVERHGGVDISVNTIAHGDVQGSDLWEMSTADFMAPVLNGVRTNFLTARAAARHMVAAGSGVILMFGGTGDTMPKLGGLTVGLDAIEALRRQLTVELGPHGVRVVSLQTGGIAETLPADMPGDMPGAAEIVAALTDATALGRCATLADVGEVAVFAASDAARAITGAAINISCGAFLDYRLSPPGTTNPDSYAATTA